LDFVGKGVINSSAVDINNNNTGQKNTLLGYRSDIDGLRALAVLLVVSFHAFNLPGGFVGVDIFFVISGFLISTILFENLHQGSFSFLNFYMRRIKRIFPALIIMLIASAILGWFLLLPGEYQQLGKHLGGASAFISNFVLWQESGYFDAEAKTKPLLHLWSLGIEEQFYIVWPLILWLALKARCNLFWLITLLALVSFSLNVLGIHSNTIATFYSPQTRFWELACGGLLAWFCFTQDFKLHLKNTMSILGALGILFCALALNKRINFPGVWALIPSLSAILIILAGEKAWFNRNILSHRFLVWVGLISFPLYLWHWPLLVFVNLSTDNKSFSHPFVKFLAVVLAFILAALTYRFIEKPIRFGRFNKLKVSLLILLISFVGLLGYQIYKQQGFNERMPPLLQLMSKAQQDKRYPLKSCFLELDQNYSEFGDCGLTREKSKKTILLWGDSHAAHLYAGYKEKFGNSVNFIVRTAAGCPPILTAKKFHTDGCKEINAHVLQLAQKEKPDKVILSGVWTNQDDWYNVSETIHQLKLAGITNIDLIGPDPWWVNSLPRQLFLYSRQSKEKSLPQRMQFGLRSAFLSLDKTMKAFAEKEKVNYFSPASVLCNEEGCLTYLDGKFLLGGKSLLGRKSLLGGKSLLGDKSLEDKSLVSEDYGHFTEPASIFVVAQLLAGQATD
jgi:peptidoglycan/LPS O-acetylase OafA/YrhL